MRACPDRAPRRCGPAPRRLPPGPRRRRSARAARAVRRSPEPWSSPGAYRCEPPSCDPLSAYGASVLSERHGSRRLTAVTDDYQGPERRSAESMLARELVLVKRREEDLRKELEL